MNPAPKPPQGAPPARPVKIDETAAAALRAAGSQSLKGADRAEFDRRVALGYDPGRRNIGAVRVRETGALATFPDLATGARCLVTLCRADGTSPGVGGVGGVDDRTRIEFYMSPWGPGGSIDMDDHWTTVEAHVSKGGPGVKITTPNHKAAAVIGGAVGVPFVGLLLGVAGGLPLLGLAAIGAALGHVLTQPKAPGPPK